MRRIWLRRMAAFLVAAAVLAIAAGALVWWKFFAEGTQSLADDRARFSYGSLDGELVAGIPYSIFMILPRVFPDLVAKYATEGYGPNKAAYGGYGAFGLAWEEGQRLPAGLSIKRLGYERVSLNCAICHTASYRLSPDEPPHFAVGGPAHTLNLQGLLRFLFAASHDRRFTAARLLPEIALHFPLDAIDWANYALVLIPKTRLALQLAEHELGWMNVKPAWGPGRDDAFNLPKFILTQTPWDDSVGNTDFPAVWRLGNRKGELLHSAGEAKSVYAVVATSAVGIGSLPHSGFEAQNEWLESFIGRLEPPRFPRPIDESLIDRGKAVYAERCAACHVEGGARTGTAIPLAELGTDPEHVLAWRQRDADRMNFVVGALGARHAEVEGAQGGYVARPLVGVWLLGPYLHNGSVPTLWDLLSAPEQRPAVFYRGYDVVDFERVGFISTGPAAEANGFRFDTGLRGNANGGHNYGTDIGDADKRALVEYLKTL
ncbi:MAG TPA: cytochrome c [Stellaceae bacterium]|nr:cytochrome c [Stellaceae bacterium]